ncbi:MAG: pyridoxamine 5'-phosphate oxidase [Actinomycetota bacterium]
MVRDRFDELSRSIASLRIPHTTHQLRKGDIDPDPLVQFGRWMEEALAAGVVLPNAMALATVSREGRPNVRMVLLKGFDRRGFVFYTNYESRKARELRDDPRAAMAFYWHQQERQVRVGGRVRRASSEEASAYFATRPAGSKLSAWASPQSRVISSRAELERSLEATRARFGNDVPLPPFWGGFRLEPDEVEFWQGMPDRLHDRLLYRRAGEAWRIERLAP